MGWTIETISLMIIIILLAIVIIIVLSVGAISRISKKSMTAILFLLAGFVMTSIVAFILVNGGKNVFVLECISLFFVAIGTTLLYSAWSGTEAGEFFLFIASLLSTFALAGTITVTISFAMDKTDRSSIAKQWNEQINSEIMTSSS